VGSKAAFVLLTFVIAKSVTVSVTSGKTGVITIFATIVGAAKVVSSKVALAKDATDGNVVLFAAVLIAVAFCVNSLIMRSLFMVE
jgi:hypothetical protein